MVVAAWEGTASAVICGIVCGACWLLVKVGGALTGGVVGGRALAGSLSCCRRKAGGALLTRVVGCWALGGRLISGGFLVGMLSLFVHDELELLAQGAAL